MLEIGINLRDVLLALIAASAGVAAGYFGHALKSEVSNHKRKPAANDGKLDPPSAGGTANA